MKVLDVLLYAQTANPDGVPGDWPADCREVDDDSPVTPGRTRMTLAQYAAYRAARQAAWNAWHAARPEPAEETQRKADKAALRAYAGNASPSQAQTVAALKALVRSLVGSD